MNVLLTFDVEVWCNGWEDLDGRFPAAFERYVYGRSSKGAFALPKTLEILERFGLRGVFFVEPLFSARFGPEYLERIVDLIRSRGQEVQLHLHPEWTDEIRPALIDDVSRKRQHLTHYTLTEQTRLLAHAKSLLEAAGSGPVTAFRSGSYAANLDTYRALASNDICHDSSLNACFEISGEGLARDNGDWPVQFEVEGVQVYPVSVFTDGAGRPRPAQIGACSMWELRDALLSGRASGREHFVIVSHNFEMLKPGSSEPDRVVVARFEALCGFLQQQRFRVVGFNDLGNPRRSAAARPSVRLSSTVRRYAEQLLRRVA